MYAQWRLQVPNQDKWVEQAEQLIQKGEQVLATHRPNPPNVIGYSTLDAGTYAEWDAQTLHFLTSVLGHNHTYVESFRGKGKPNYLSSARIGIGILRAVRDDLRDERIILDRPKTIDPLTAVEAVCNRFHLVVRQLRSRHQNRQTLSVQDEYDVQDLLHSLLWLYFEDIRAEEYTPSYAGKASRLDFLLKREQVVIEVKKTSPSLGVKEIATQLIEDIERYKAHPDCKALCCFVYDPEAYIPNPRGLEDDLRRDDHPFPVRVFIRPS
jgi:hypothetical protein